jgi:hypothetical protein
VFTMRTVVLCSIINTRLVFLRHSACNEAMIDEVHPLSGKQYVSYKSRIAVCLYIKYTDSRGGPFLV